MNLIKLFAMQKELQEKISYNKDDLFEKVILALLVEIGELANEWRGFKFWSKNQKPVLKKSRVPYVNLEDAEFYNPLLEEFVDGLHFILLIGLLLGYEPTAYVKSSFKFESITNQFIDLYWEVSNLADTKSIPDYVALLRHYIGLGEMLGFTWIKIEQAYREKHAINIQRQEQGY